MKHRILLGLTTTPRSDWRNKIKEIEQFQIKELALFPTMLATEERKELYSLLEDTGVEIIPHVHIRDDMESWELDLLSRKYKTSLFNIHLSERFGKITSANARYLDRIYIENNYGNVNGFPDYLKKTAGICLDLSHYHDMWIIQKLPAYAKFPDLLRKFPIGCCHISAIRKNPVTYNSWDIKVPGINQVYSCHLLDKLTEIDYVKDYIGYLPKYVSIELENSFKEQLEIKKRLEKIING